MSLILLSFITFYLNTVSYGVTELRLRWRRIVNFSVNQEYGSKYKRYRNYHNILRLKIGKKVELKETIF